MTFSFILMAAVLHSPKGQETFEGVRMAPPLPIPMAVSLVLPPSLVTNNFTWHGSTEAWGYRLYQASGSRTNTYDCTDTNITIVFYWPDDVERFSYWVTATNFVSESDPSGILYIPPLPPTHIIISWSGASVTISNSTKLPPAWSRLTNASSPLILPIQPGSRFFSAGTNKLSLTATNL